MRRIELPATNTISFTLTQGIEGFGGIAMPDGTQHVSLGGIGEKDWENLNIARENGGKILWSTVCLEKKMEDILLTYFMGPFNGPCEKRELFTNELLQASFLQLSSKKHLISKVSNRFYSFKGKERDKLQGYLKSIIQWRNAFAHGNMTLSATEGVILNYYSGAPKSEALNDGFWKTVESAFRNCDELLNKLEDIVKQAKNQKTAVFSTPII